MAPASRYLNDSDHHLFFGVSSKANFQANSFTKLGAPVSQIVNNKYAAAQQSAMENVGERGHYFVGCGSPGKHERDP